MTLAPVCDKTSIMMEAPNADNILDKIVTWKIFNCFYGNDEKIQDLDKIFI